MPNAFHVAHTILLLGAGLGLAPAALAAAPVNDNLADATLIDTVPFADAEDTTGATAEVGELDWWGWGPGASVWYQWTADADGWVAADTSGSEPSAGCFGDPADGCYDTTVTIWTVDAFGGYTAVAQNDDAEFGVRTSLAPFEAIAGETYYIQVASFNAGGGGDLLFSLDTYTPPPPFLMNATVTQVQSTLKTGEVKAEGTIVCSEPGTFSVNLTLDQTAGRFRTQIFVWATGTCDTGTTTWTGAGFSSGGVLVGRASYTLASFGAASETGQVGSAVTSGSITAKGRGR